MNQDSSYCLPYKIVRLKRNEEKKLFKGEPWVYRDELENDTAGLAPGELVRLHTWKNDFVATAYINTATTIAARVLSLDGGEMINGDFFRRRIEAADAMRRSVRPLHSCYRMVYGEADRLPGLVIDRYDNYFVIQITTAGIERFKLLIFDIISSLHPGCILVEKSIGASREKESLPNINQLIPADASPEKTIEVNDLKFRLNFLKSQKTGFFLDQRDNYLLLRHISQGREVLDVFSYSGAWGLHAHRFGARHVSFLEVSNEYLAQTRENIAANQMDPGVFELIHADAVPALKEMCRSGVQKDVIILDPPAFIKSRGKIREGIRGYKEINLRGLKMIRQGGFLISCSCSHFFTREDFLKVITEAAFDAGRRVQLLALTLQPPDHPVLLPLYKSEYLKCALFAVS